MSVLVKLSSLACVPRVRGGATGIYPLLTLGEPLTRAQKEVGEGELWRVIGDRIEIGAELTSRAPTLGIRKGGRKHGKKADKPDHIS